MPYKDSKEIKEVFCNWCQKSLLKQKDSLRRWSGLCRSCASRKQVFEGKVKLESGFKHGDTGSELWNIWRSAKKYWLFSSRKSGIFYPFYEKWLDYISFKEWALINGYFEGASLKRKVIDKGWTPDNCIFVKFTSPEIIEKACLVCNNSYTTIHPESVTCSTKCAGIYRGNKRRASYQSNPNETDYLSFINRKVEGAYKRAKDKNIECTLTTDFIYSLYVKQNKKCALTGKELTFIKQKGKVPTNLSIDRIDSSKGYTENNVHLVCTVVNLMKLDLDLNNFKEWCQFIVNYHE